MTCSYGFKVKFNIASQDRTGGGVIRETKIPVQELWLKLGGGLICERGRVRGTLW